VTNAKAHLGQTLVVNLDLSDFFPSITFPRVRGLFQWAGYSPAAATLLALLTTESSRSAVEHDGTRYWVAVRERALPQGACTSPAISNQIARRLDRRLAGAAAKLGWRYTRYADDLTFSGDPAAKARTGFLLARVRRIVGEEGFRINEKKGRVQRSAARQEVTGIVVNEKLGVPREEVRRIRAILHAAQKTGLAAQNRTGDTSFEARLRGKIGYVMMVDPAKGRALRAALDGLPR
jgi:RNA-directed DNA polymerase